MDENAIKKAVKEAMHEQLDQFLVEREQHYLDHSFIKDVREAKENITKNACAVVTKGGLTGLAMLLLWGIIEWVRRSKI